MTRFIYHEIIHQRGELRDWWEYPIPINDPKPRQVVAATINRPLSRKREPEQDPVRLDLVIQVQNYSGK